KPFLTGRAVAVPDLGRLAELAAEIHSVDPTGFGHEYFPWYEGTTTTPPVPSARPELWARAIELWHTSRPAFEPVFVHRDLHPGNVLWTRQRVSGIVDWANACRGPRGCDVAHCRSNLTVLGGADAADRFLAAYQAVTGETYHPYWELAGLLEREPAYWTPSRVAEQERSLARLVAEVSAAASG
ncbi:MAG: aminoglycoside phosphotransferase family protein, partial [Acidimicrobiales bacterium]